MNQNEKVDNNLENDNEELLKKIKKTSGEENMTDEQAQKVLDVFKNHVLLYGLICKIIKMNEGPNRKERRDMDKNKCRCKRIKVIRGKIFYGDEQIDITVSKKRKEYRKQQKKSSKSIS